MSLALHPLDEPASLGAGSPLGIGALVRWVGQRWIVTGDYSHPRWGRFLRIERPIEGAYDLVHVNGADGGIEPLGPA